MKEDKKQTNQSPIKKIESNEIKLNEFVKYIRPFEWYGPQRDLSPELKRIVKNLVCQEHKYVYCPQCKKYDEVEYDPIENINKFMKFIREEQDKISPKKKIGKKKRGSCDDSASDITNLEKEEILTKYYEKKLTKIQKQKLEREKASKRLHGGNNEMKHVCSTQHRMLNKYNKNVDEVVEIELRQRSLGIEMNDEDLSAHQFSLRDQSIQADSEERLEI